MCIGSDTPQTSGGRSKQVTVKATRCWRHRKSPATGSLSAAAVAAVLRQSVSWSGPRPSNAPR